MTSLSQRLKQDTSTQHDAAETSPFISSLMRGERSGADYARLIGQYVHLYRALEYAVGRLREHNPALTPLLDERLDRLAYLEQDYSLLAARYNLPLVAAPTSATAEYIARLHHLAAFGDPLDEYRLLAHHYLRYLGDLSGGQAIATLVSRHYGIAEKERRAWDFSELGKLKVYKDGYRENLSAAVQQAEAQDALIREAQHGFDLNRALFNSLDPHKELTPIS